MNAKPVAAIERIREWSRGNAWHFAPPRLEAETIVAWADSIPDGAVPVVWPAHLTREFLLRLIDDLATSVDGPTMNLVRAIQDLAAIAPERKRRVVNLWQHVADDLPVCRHPKWQPDPALACNWTLIKRNVELED